MVICHGGSGGRFDVPFGTPREAVAFETAMREGDGWAYTAIDGEGDMTEFDACMTAIARRRAACDAAYREASAEYGEFRDEDSRRARARALAARDLLDDLLAGLGDEVHEIIQELA